MANYLRNVWHAMSQGFRDPNDDSDSTQDEVREAAVKEAWQRSFGDDELVFFGAGVANIDLSTLHPAPIQIFQLWQIYLDNVNPLLKVTHVPSLQSRIIEAVGDLNSISHTLEALMFSIYCTAILSLQVDECQTTFGSSQSDLLARYRFGCQQALLNSGFLRSDDRDCLTALLLYLISIRPAAVPVSLATILATAIRIAQRMGIQSEATLAKLPALEAEMRRRLWWALVLFDTRVSETTNHGEVTLGPTWDCKIPLNVNDSDLRPGMKEPRAFQGTTTDALFAVVRSKLGDFLRYNTLHLDITNPVLKQIARPSQSDSISGETDDISRLEAEIEAKYLKFCDEENPLHFLTIWTTRAQLAKWRLMEHCLKYIDDASIARTESQRDTATSIAMRVLQCDTKIMSSPLTRGFVWLHHLYFPFPAYLQVAQDLRTRPHSKLNRQAWEVLSDDYEAWSKYLDDKEGRGKSPVFLIFAKLILQAWDTSKTSGHIQQEPKIVSSILETMAQTTMGAQEDTDTDTAQPANIMDMGIDELSMSMPMNFVDQNLSYDMAVQARSMFGPAVYSGMAPQPTWSLQDRFSWNSMSSYPGWGGF
ncbi:uncharacterized protein A1O9_04326 [Exophiala aquamarina CBS 119918]|uniref:Xylanolytic transcriptional activator regulatory domain-containing protein n=1 Tax=Exophiala aquamarina CBS 119918 TaxID=1182545 RepID=A0A072PI98_9EURO|nr:uncharacterized protein A1O9_04326 [Exophiala aquamarina CBS 119918]KEF59482.1 hypothetical protein A1O9_04326 [Exophiala aquamarina CBS 119918]